ncbi:hypothetical protein C8Q75DRAFT_741096 [Abortiporus biennis]|nr:hypothetical protein C8Q75DRAFT_741096 [Abortiporus biennis]
MLGLRDEITRQATFAPRAHLEGINLPSTFKLPTLSAVRQDIALRASLNNSDFKDTRAVYVGKLGAHPTGVGATLQDPLGYNMALPNLFKFAYFTHVEDVPDEFLEDVIWGLQMFIRVLTECSEEELRAVGHYLPHQEAKLAGYFMISNSRYKLCRHLLNPKIDSPQEALPILRAAVDEHVKRLRDLKIRRAPWLENPGLYSLLGDALVSTGEYTEETKLILEHVLQAVEGSPGTAEFTHLIIRTRIHLSLVYKELGVEKKKQKEHTEWAAKFIKKTPKMIPIRTLRQMIDRDGQPRHPVYEAIGGLDWIDERPSIPSRQSNRMAKNCRNCGGREPLKTLSRCSGCKHIWYCSRECQRANWKMHKDSCREMAEARAKAEALKAVDPKGGQQAEDWIKWRNGSHFANTRALCHALGLHKDPSRGRTHIVFRNVEYAPKASKDIQYKFRITGATVYKIEDVLNEIELLMGLDPGEGKEYLANLIHEIDEKNTDGAVIVPMLDLTFGDGVQTWLGSIGMPLDQIRKLPYDPQWREKINIDGPAGALRLRTGAKDVEFEF